jgi:hypothetical protein
MSSQVTRQRNIKIPLQVWGFHSGAAELFVVGFDATSLLLVTRCCSGPETTWTDYSVTWCHIPEKWKSQEPPLVNYFENLTVTEKMCFTYCFLYVVRHILHSDRYLASKCVGYMQKYMWGPTCSIIICYCPILAIIFGCSDKF